MASMGLTSDEQKKVEDFRKDVVEPSMTKLVVLDFWAEWCGPCKALTPVLEKVCAEYADKGVVLAKIDVDDNKFIASQFQVQSIPTVYAMFGGQPVADMTQARSESQVKALLDQLLEKLPVEAGGGSADAQSEPDIVPLLAMGEDVLEAGDAQRAFGIFGQIADMAPDNMEAVSGLIRALVAADRTEEAQTLLDELPEEHTGDPALGRAKSALALAAEAPPSGEAERLKAEVEANPGDHATRLDYASALFADKQRDAAAEELLTIIHADREWNEGAARTKLLQIFETVGLEDPWVSATRRKLSAALFG